LNPSLELEVIRNQLHLIVGVPNTNNRLRIVFSVTELSDFIGALQEALVVAKTPEPE
jgi:hypothetical protein